MKRKRTEYFRTYNAARQEYQNAYRQQPEQKAKAKIRSALWRAKIKEQCPQRPKHIRKPRTKVSRRAVLTKEEKAATVQRYRIVHRASILQMQRKWREENRERERLRARLYRLEFPDKSLAIRARYEEKHPEIRRIRSSRRRAIRLGAEIGNQEVIKVWELGWRKKRYVRCYWCNGKFSPTNCHADHIHPLARNGEHSIENLCISCSYCNLQKHVKLPKEWNSILAQPVLL